MKERVPEAALPAVSELDTEFGRAYPSAYHWNVIALEVEEAIEDQGNEGQVLA